MEGGLVTLVGQALRARPVTGEELDETQVPQQERQGRLVAGLDGPRTRELEPCSRLIEIVGEHAEDRGHESCSPECAQKSRGAEIALRIERLRALDAVHQPERTWVAPQPDDERV